MPSWFDHIEARQMPRLLDRYKINEALAREGFQLNPRKGKLGRVYIDIRKSGSLVTSYRVNTKEVGWEYAYGLREYFKVVFTPQLLDAAKLGLLNPKIETYEID